MKYYKGKYYQGNMSDGNAQKILDLLQHSVVPELKHCIYNIPDYTIEDLVKEVEAYEEMVGSLEGYKTDLLRNLKMGELRDEQTIGVAFMFYAGSALLGDSVGLGKTVEVSGLVNMLYNVYRKNNRDFKFCFLTEKASVEQIRNKLIRFTGKYVGMLESSEKHVVDRYLSLNENRRYYSIVGSHSLLTCSQFLIDCKRRPFDLFVVDESYILKNSSNDMYKDTKSLFKVVDKKILLNATPLETDIMEFYNQLALLDKDYLPTKTEFKAEHYKWGKTIYGYGYTGYKSDNAESFREAITLRYLARNRGDLNATYEDNKHQTVVVPLSDAQKKLMKKTTLYRMVSDYPPAVDKNIEFSLENVPKMAALVEVLSILDIKVDKALIYCTFKECQAKMKEILLERGYLCDILNGDTKVKDKKEIIRNFKEGVIDILITNVQKGLDLEECNNCVIYSIDPNPQKMIQFEGRMTRELDVVGKTVILLVAMGKEKKFVEDKLKIRVDASNTFLVSGRSMVADAVSTEGNKKMFEFDK